VTLVDTPTTVAPVAAMQDPLFVFLHNPRTGGTSLREVIKETSKELGRASRDRQLAEAAELQDSTAYEFSRMPIAPPTVYEDSGDFQAIATSPFLTPNIRFLLQGHLRFGVHEQLARECWYLTLVRDPVERVASLYHWFRERERAAPSGNPLRQQLLNLPLKQVLEKGIWKEFSNGQTRRIAGMDPRYGDNHNQLIKQALDNIERYFIFVGTQERYEESLRVLSSLFSWPEVASRRSRARGIARETDTEDADTIALIHELNILDDRLFRYANKFLDRDIATFGEPLAKRLRRLRRKRDAPR